MNKPLLHPGWFIAVTLLVQQAHAQDQAPELLDLSLEDLLEVEVAVPSAITLLRVPETPASTTVITEEQILGTPARNLYDLIEVYVPGALWVNQEGGVHPGIRGNVADGNYRYLLLVNGRVLNTKADYGAKTELEQWDLGDVQEVEIVRGPGSVTYGPGAVAGVINIKTHNAQSAPGSRIRARTVSRYDSVGASASHGHLGDGFDAYIHASVTRTRGFEARHFLANSQNQAGYVGSGIEPGTPPLDYFGDAYDQPQLKLHWSVAFDESWEFWGRFTQQGSRWAGNETKTDVDGHWVNLQGLQDRQVTLTAKRHTTISEQLDLTTTLSLDSYDGERRGAELRAPDVDHPLNKTVDFSETEFYAQGVLNWRPTKRAEIAAGMAYSFDSFGPPWLDDERSMRLGEGGIIVNGPDSRAIEDGNGGSAARRDTEVYVGDGWHTHTVSAFLESRSNLTPWLKVLASGRADKNTYTELLYSPRLALLGTIDDSNFVKLIAQRSVRMNTAAQLLIEDRAGRETHSEKLNSLELVYAAYPARDLSLSASGYLNQMDVIAENVTKDLLEPVGEHLVRGLELEAHYAWSTASLGGNYSLTDQVSWKLAPGVPSSSVSYADYALPIEDTAMVLQGVGNDLNNWPNHALKVFGRLELGHFTTLADARLFWGYQGARDGLVALGRAVAGEPVEPQTLAALERVEAVGAYEAALRADLSIAYHEPASALTSRFFVQNLIGTGHNKRYSFDRGNDDAAPSRVRFVEEPRTFGITLEYRP